MFFFFKSCRRLGENIKCNFNIKNKAGKRMYIASYDFTLVDSAGKSFEGNELKINQLHSDGKDLCGDCSVPTIVAKSEYVVEVTFEKISEQITQVRLFKFGN
jgi:hypothetical protein